MTFNPNDHMMKLKSKEGTKDYLPVQARLAWFREACPQGTIDTEERQIDLDREEEAEVFVWNAEKRRSEKVLKKAKGYARIKAIVTDGKGGRATGTKTERAVDFLDYVEKAETGAIGRALAALGYGTLFALDFDEGHRIVDAPVERASNTPTPPKSQEASAEMQPMYEEGRDDPQPKEPPATSPQLESIGKLCQYLGKAEPDTQGLSNLEARRLIQQLTLEYRQAKQRTATVR